MQAPRLVTVLGSTGSIGVSTLDVIARHPQQFEVYALTARQSVAVMLEQCQQFQPRYAVMLEPQAAAQLREQLLSARQAWSRHWRLRSKVSRCYWLIKKHW